MSPASSESVPSLSPIALPDRRVRLYVTTDRSARGPHFLGHALAASGFYVSTERDRPRQHVKEPIMRKRAFRATSLDPSHSRRRPSAKQLSLSTETLRSLRSIAERDLDLAWGGRGSCSNAITGCG
jgi:hypothetical protein